MKGPACVIVAVLAGCVSHTMFVRRVELRGQTLVIEKCPINSHDDVVETVVAGCVTETVDVPAPVDVDEVDP